MFDRKVWESIGNKKSCSFKLDTKVDTLCRNKYNVVGICSEFNCPLANTKYATVRSIDEKLYLFIKEPERVHSPARMYERILLSEDYHEALKEIENNLEFWDEELIHKCKQRLTKLTEYHERIQEAKEKGMTKLMPRATKMNRREKMRALRALNTLNFEQEIGEELMLRLEAGIYGEEAKYKYETAREKHKKQQSKRYVTDFEESEEASKPSKKKTKTKKDKKEQAVTEW